MTVFDKIKELADGIGFTESGFLETENLKYYPEVRAICEGNTCRGYGASWACPPAVGTIEECKARVSEYDKMLLFSKKYDLEDSFDFEAMTEGMRDFKKLCDDFNKEAKSVLSEYLLLSNEGCGRCARCTYPDAPCRFPELLYHSLEGYGFIVNELAKEAGMRYNNGSNTVTYFGALLFSDK